jgi:hypothetical protein
MRPAAFLALLLPVPALAQQHTLLLWPNLFAVERNVGKALEELEELSRTHDGVGD